MKKLIYLISIAWVVLGLSGCNDFLDTQSFTQKNSETYPKTADDATQLLTGVYSSLNATLTGPVVGLPSSYFFAAEMAADYRFGGGGVNDLNFQADGHLLYSNRNEFEEFWTAHYKGIARANGVLAALQNMPEGDVKNQKLGEAKVLRAHLYFELVQLLGNVPLMTSAPADVSEAKVSPPQATQDEIYTLIGSDLWEAYSTMPSIQYNAVPSGTVTKWAAAGLLARVYLFYTGFYNKPTLPTNDGEVTGDQVAAALKDCIDNSGHDLVKDYRSLWSYTNSLTKPDYPYAKTADTWVKDGQNPEHVFVVKMTQLGNYNTSTGYSNQLALYFALRNGTTTNYENIFPMGQGWGAGPVNSKMWEQWVTDEPNDIRRAASIYNQATEAIDYSGQWGADHQMEETGMWQKKIVAITAHGGTNAGSLGPKDLWMSFCSSPTYYNMPDDNFQLANATDIIYIRFADILLMHSEITKTTDGINKVRARVGLPPVAGYSDDALRKERLHELAFEGTRWGDIRRWGIAEQVLATKNGVAIHNDGLPATVLDFGGGVVARYKATNGFFMIPQTEVDLSNGAYTQNPGWGTDALYSGYPKQ